jgi:hypothetical protein
VFFRVAHGALQSPKTRLNTEDFGDLAAFQYCTILSDFGLFFEVLLAGY